MIPKEIPQLQLDSPLSGSQALMFIAIGVLVLAVIVFILSIAVFLHHIVTDRQRKLNRQRFEAASLALAPHIVANDPQLDQAVSNARRTHGDRAVALVLRRARHDIRGPVVDRLSQVLHHMGEVHQLLKEARSRRDWRRAVAVRGLGECGGEDARRAMIAAASDQSPEVRRAAREGLLTEGQPDSIQVAIDSFLEDLPRRAGWRRSFYARLASVASVELLTLVKSGKLDATEEKLAFEALGDGGCREALPLAVTRLTSEDSETRTTAVRVVGKLGGDRELESVMNALNDQEWFVRAAAARSVEWILLNMDMMKRSGYQDLACERLGAKLTDPKWWVRANAARALARSGRPGVETLMRMTSSSDAFARDAAFAALAMAPLTSEARLTVRDMIAKNQQTPKATPQPGIHTQGSAFA